jgi:hypothetical protein
MTEMCSCHATEVMGIPQVIADPDCPRHAALAQCPARTARRLPYHPNEGKNVEMVVRCGRKRGHEGEHTALWLRGTMAWDEATETKG